MLFMDTSLIIRSFNAACLKFFDRSPSQILNKPLFEILPISASPTAATTSFIYAVVQATQSLKSPCIEYDIQLDFPSGPRRIRASLVAVTATGTIPARSVLATGLAIFTLVLRPLPPEVLAREQLLAEREKAELLLANVLSETVIDLRRANPDMHGIAFSVENPIFLFVELVPSKAWGPPQTDRTVISTLDEIFAGFDDVLAGYPELVKIKRVNGTYLAAGGIFTEVSTPDISAKQAVLAALGMMAALASHNVATRAKVKAVCGIWLQAEVVAALMELAVPTFEIFGMPIERLRIMAQSGKPMDVIVSRSVYELIYGPNDRIREGAVITFGARQFQTYIVKAVEE
jgi:hypothetical protein